MHTAAIIRDWKKAGATRLSKSRFKPGKRIKRARATLRLLRASIGDVTYGREDEALRSAARQFNGVNSWHR